ncbi:hypothetical protein H8959_019818, partial [Pygathrix nigripes]
ISDERIMVGDDTCAPFNQATSHDKCAERKTLDWQTSKSMLREKIIAMSHLLANSSRTPLKHSEFRTCGTLDFQQLVGPLMWRAGWGHHYDMWPKRRQGMRYTSIYTNACISLVHTVVHAALFPLSVSGRRFRINWMGFLISEGRSSPGIRR